MNFLLLVITNIHYCVQTVTDIKMVLEGIREKIEDEKLDLTYDQRERAMWEYEHAVVETEAWKTHLLRAFHQDLARLL